MLDSKQIPLDNNLPDQVPQDKSPNMPLPVKGQPNIAQDVPPIPQNQSKYVLELKKKKEEEKKKGWEIPDVLKGTFSKPEHIVEPNPDMTPPAPTRHTGSALGKFFVMLVFIIVIAGVIVGAIFTFNIVGNPLKGVFSNIQIGEYLRQVPSAISALLSSS